MILWSCLFFYRVDKLPQNKRTKEVLLNTETRMSQEQTSEARINSGHGQRLWKGITSTGTVDPAATGRA